MSWAKVASIRQKANYVWFLVTTRKETPLKGDKTEDNQMGKKGSIPNSPSTQGGRGVRERGYARIGKKMIFIIVLLFGNNLQYKFNIWLQGVFIRTTPPTLPHTHTYTHTHIHTHIFYIYYQLTTEIKITFLFIILWWFLISPWLFAYEFIEVKLFLYVI